MAPIMGTDQKLVDKLVRAGKKTYDRVWQLPLSEEYSALMKSEVADVRSINKYISAEAGTITAGEFLSTFVESPWAHIDIGGASWLPRTEDYTIANATGFGLRLFVEFLKNY